ncbi:MAG: oxidoreductase, partial [Candidatus Saccharibacteria bacterium]|nr:oxidoreductase [Candidatus Saccharibacteria bacterium]
MSKQFWGVVIVVVLLFIGVFALGGNGSKGADKKSPGTLTQHVAGKGTAGVTLTEYGDFQCPYCEQYATTVQQVQAKYGDQIKFQFRNYPLTSLHPNAFAAARAAEAAGLQNKYWEMHDALYIANNWQVWTGASDAVPYFNQYAQQLGLNVDQFKKDYLSSKVNDLINADMAEGGKLGITGTPTFFLDGKKVDVSNSAASFE